MFIALTANECALQRSAMCFGAFSLHAAPDGAGYISNMGAINMVLLRSKNLRYQLIATFRAKRLSPALHEKSNHVGTSEAKKR